MDPELEQLEKECKTLTAWPAEYSEKMIHFVPEAPTLDRIKYIENAFMGKIVLSLGGTGPGQEALDRVARKCYVIDKEPLDRKPGTFIQMDLDQMPEEGTQLPSEVDVIFLGEILEHLTNPGNVLRMLRGTYPELTLIVTVPNAFCEAGRSLLLTKNVENINKDHVAYYSFHTLKVLGEKCGYAMQGFYWYNGSPKFSEGLIMVFFPRSEAAKQEIKSEKKLQTDLPPLEEKEV